MKHALFTLFTFFYFPLWGQITYYVNSSVLGGDGSGDSWVNAFSRLQSALDIADAGDSIWVAKGTYYPTEGLDRYISFELKNGIKLLGGFEGTETFASQRNVLLHETILSGNIGEPHGFDNSLHVLYGSGLDSTTLLDGLIITKGNAIGGIGEDAYYGGGLLLRPSADVYCTCPVIQNCRFEYNYGGNGGAVCMLRWDVADNYVNAIFRDCRFVFNRSRTAGGAVSKIGANGANTPFVLESCTFSDNSCSMGEGGGIYFSRVEHTTVIRNCTFERDTAVLSIGGGIFLAAGYEEFIGSTLILDSCTFRQNVATEGAGFVYFHVFANNVSNPPFSALIENCRFESNFSNNGGGSACVFWGLLKSRMTVEIKNSLFRDNRAKGLNTIYFQGFSECDSKLDVDNCLFFNNRRSTNPESFCFCFDIYMGGAAGKMDINIKNSLFAGNGAGISSLCSEEGGKLNTHITSCTFFSNEDYIFNKNYFPDFDGITKFTKVHITNCVVWEPDADLWTMFSDNDPETGEPGGYFVDYSLLSLHQNIINNYPMFGDHIIANEMPHFIDPEAEDFRLQACSPGVNAGFNLIPDTLNILQDLAGNPRILNDTIDLGAYETPDSCIIISTQTPGLIDPNYAILFPNPVGSNESIFIHSPYFSRQKAECIIYDAQGRQISQYDLPVLDSDHISVKAPQTTGHYWLELRSDTHKVRLKVMVGL